MIKDWFNDSYFDPFEAEWEGRPNKYKIDPSYTSMTLDDFVAENKLGGDKNFLNYAAKHHIVPWRIDGYDTKKLDLLLQTYKNILDYETKRDAKLAAKNADGPTGIANPADYMSKVTFEKDTDGDGDTDIRVTKIKDEG